MRVFAQESNFCTFFGNNKFLKKISFFLTILHSAFTQNVLVEWYFFPASQNKMTLKMMHWNGNWWINSASGVKFLLLLGISLFRYRHFQTFTLGRERTFIVINTDRVLLLYSSLRCQNIRHVINPTRVLTILKHSIYDSEKDKQFYSEPGFYSEDEQIIIIFNYCWSFLSIPRAEVNSKLQETSWAQP
jgi:hypothetical protein